jgi:hypothetical protein
MTSRLHHQLATYEVNIGGNLRMNIDTRVGARFLRVQDGAGTRRPGSWRPCSRLARLRRTAA